MQKQISQNARTRKNNWKKFAGAGVVGAFAFVPFFTPVAPAEAQPPTWGYGDRDRYCDRDRDGRYDNDRRGREERTLEGIVSNDRAGREFILRLDNGQRIQVRSDEREPRRLTDGDRVRVRGYFTRSGERNRSNTRYNESRMFFAEDVQIIRNRSGNRGGYGGGYGNGSYGGANGSYVNFLATVIDANERARQVRVRGDNGREYVLRVEDKDDVDSLRRGERVRVRGYFRNGVIIASDVDEL